MPEVPVIEFRDFSFQYYSRKEPTLHNINLKINKGEKILIAGASGSGKSTLAHCLNGLIPHSYRGTITGELFINGKSVAEQSIFDRSKRIGTVLQDSDGQFVGLSVGEDIAFALENDCRPQNEMKEIVRKTAELVDMGEFLKASPYELSGGQKQRVSFAGVMVDDVDILLFDEPLANLDPATGKTAIDLIDRIHREYDKTVIIIEHRIEDVLYRNIDRVIVIDDGHIVSDMSPDELMTTDIFKQNGIREPLYVTALKHAGIKVTQDMCAGRLDTLKLSDEDKKKLIEWSSQPVQKEKSGTEPLLELRHINFRYTDRKEILKDINIKIGAGEMVSIVGTNGAGKSTLAKVICGFEVKDKGDILFKGDSLWGYSIREIATHIGYVMQNPNQMICNSFVYDEVAFGLRNRHMDEEEAKKRVEKALRICGLYPFRNWPISALSFGQKKRVTIASMLVMEPEILILDEPTAGQDYRHYTDIMEFLKSLNSAGITIIMITHDMHLMLEYTPHAIVLHNGQIRAEGTAVDILTDEAVVEDASLKLTSLYELALSIGMDEPQKLVGHFIDYEREAGKGETYEDQAL